MLIIYLITKAYLKEKISFNKFLKFISLFIKLSNQRNTY